VRIENGKTESARRRIRLGVTRLVGPRELVLEGIDASEMQFVLLVRRGQVGGEVRGALRQHLDLGLQLADVAADAGRQHDLLGHDLSLIQAIRAPQKLLVLAAT
jgi:hypothetical protein